MKDEVSVPRWVLFWSIALGGAAFDLVTKSLAFARIGEPPFARPVSVIPNVLELYTSYNSGALWGFGGNLPYSSLIFAGLSVVAAVAICYWLFVKGASSDGRLTAALGLIMAAGHRHWFDRLALNHPRHPVPLHLAPIRLPWALFNFPHNMHLPP